MNHFHAARVARRQRLHGAFGWCQASRFNWMAYGTSGELRSEKGETEAA